MIIKRNKKSQIINIEKLTLILMIGVILVIGYNTIQLSNVKNPNIKNGNAPINNINNNVISNNNANNNNFQNFKENNAIDVIPTGRPRIYGDELGVKYDDVSPNDQKRADETIKKIGILDSEISLNGKNLERYISVAGKISCEYCCGVDSIIFSDGKAACGCAHSFAMRGLAKYLIKNHGNEFTDDEILEELGKWKTLFFPSKIAQKADVLKEKGIELNYINLASNRYRGIENGN